MSTSIAIPSLPPVGGVAVADAARAPDPGGWINPADAFLCHLAPHLVHTDAQRREVFRLRHKVYAEELGYEPLRPDRQETDDFDRQSHHCSVRHRRSGMLAGTLRVVGVHRAGDELPLQRYCHHALQHPVWHPSRLPAHEVCEISRLAVPALFRRQQVGMSDASTPRMAFSAEEVAVFPMVAVGLYLMAVALTCRLGRHHVFVMMEPRLARGLGFVGIRFERLGDGVDYHGRRAAYHIDSRHIANGLAPAYLDLLQRIDARLSTP